MKKKIALIMVLTLLVGLLPTGGFAGSDTDYNNIEYPNEGALTLNKTAEKIAGKDNQWKVSLELTGLNLDKTSDVVLVLDRSGSMDGTRIASEISAANQFVDNLLADSKSKNRVAVVSYAGETRTYDSGNPFKSYNNKQNLEAEITGINANGGTFTQAGLHEAQRILDNYSDADEKFIVLLSDGLPTYSYPIKSNRTFTNTGYRTIGFYTVDSWGQYRWNNKTGYVHETNQPGNASQFNYFSRVGTGTSNLGYINQNWPNLYFYNHTQNTIAESKFIRDKGTQIYSIGLELDSTGQHVMDNVAPGKSYSATSSNLDSIFQTIAGNISFAATNARIVDRIGDQFYIPGITSSNIGSKIKVDQGVLNYNASTKTITWDVDKVTQGNPAKMSYVLEIDSGARKNRKHPTNPEGYEAYATYTNALNQDAKKTFNTLELGINVGIININRYRVNDAGQPVNSSGEIVAQKEHALMDTVPYTHNGKENLKFNVKYQVDAIGTMTNNSVDYVFNGNAQNADVNPKNITIYEENPTHEVWFGYSEASQVDSIEVKVPSSMTVKLVGNSEATCTLTAKDQYGDDLTVDASKIDWEIKVPLAGVSIDQSGLLTVTNKADATKTFTVIATYEGETDEALVSLVDESFKIDLEGVVTGGKFDLSWSEVVGAVGYKLEKAYDKKFTSIALIEDLGSTSKTYSDDVQNDTGKTLYYRVKAKMSPSAEIYTAYSNSASLKLNSMGDGYKLNIRMKVAYEAIIPSEQNIEGVNFRLELDSNSLLALGYDKDSIEIYDENDNLISSSEYVLDTSNPSRVLVTPIELPSGGYRDSYKLKLDVYAKRNGNQIDDFKAGLKSGHTSVLDGKSILELPYVVESLKDEYSVFTSVFKVMYEKDGNNITYQVETSNNGSENRIKPQGMQ